MITIIHAKNIDLTDSIRAMVEEKLASLAKFLNDKESESAEARVEVGRPSLHHNKGLVHSAEINLKVGGNLFRAEAEHEELRTAVDFAKDELEKQIKKQKEKNIDASRQANKI